MVSGIAKCRTWECSTPFGIRYGITGIFTFLWFEHSLKCSTPFGIRYGITPCRMTLFSGDHSAQRLSASDMESLEFRLVRILTCFVLNAFRHQIWNHQKLHRAHRRVHHQCSTPFGIRYGITTSFNRHACSLLQCSTPFGIRYGITPPARQQEIGGGDDVLNAFRHQIWNHVSPWSGSSSVPRCSTPFGIRYGITRSRPGGWFGFDRAQRLSASDMESLRATRHDCRPHLCSTPFGIRYGITRANPGRRSRPSGAQRLSASDMESLRKSTERVRFSECSTPFGIRYGITRKPPLTETRRFVLNAFRHQIWNHGRTLAGPNTADGCAQRLSASDMESRLTPPRSFPLDHWCSTPFGIRYGITASNNATCSSLSCCAQRLSASDMESLDMFLRRPPTYVCAQRLSASDMESLAIVAREAAAPLCSTPFGIRYGITLSAVGSLRLVHSCSTPFGIRYGITPKSG